jgi:hypothetical protein
VRRGREDGEIDGADESGAGERTLHFGRVGWAKRPMQVMGGRLCAASLLRRSATPLPVQHAQSWRQPHPIGCSPMHGFVPVIRPVGPLCHIVVLPVSVMHPHEKSEQKQNVLF